MGTEECDNLVEEPAGVSWMAIEGSIYWMSLRKTSVNILTR